MTAKQEIIKELKQRIGAIQWHDEGINASYALGVDEIDAVLKHGGLAAGACHEIICLEEGPSLGFALLLLSSMVKKTNRPILWCSNEQDFHTLGFRSFGLKDSHTIFVKTDNQKQSLWATEQGLLCHDFSAVVLNTTGISLAQGRRLKLLTKKHGTTAILLLRANSKTPMPAIATTRWQISAQLSLGQASRNSIMSVGPPRLSIKLLRNLGGIAPLSWTLELDEQTLRFYPLPQLLSSTNQDHKKRPFVSAGKRTA